MIYQVIERLLLLDASNPPCLDSNLLDAVLQVHSECGTYFALEEFLHLICLLIARKLIKQQAYQNCQDITKLPS